MKRFQITLLCFLAGIMIFQTGGHKITSLTDCSTPSEYGGIGGCPVNGKVQVTVIEQGFPAKKIANAFIMIGDARNQPFAPNYTWSDSSGNAVITNTALPNPYNITVGIAGYTIVTINQVSRDQLIIPLAPIKNDGSDLVKIRGNITGYIRPHIAKIYLGFVLKEQTIAQLMGFNFIDILEPFYQTDIYGTEVWLPGNIAIPPQKMVKNDYTILTEKDRPLDVVALGGSINPFTMIKLYFGFSDFGQYVSSVINAISFDKAGVLQNVNPAQPSQNITLNQPLLASLKFSVANLPNNSLDVMAASLRYSDEAKKYYGTGLAIMSGPSSMVTAVQANQAFSGLKLGGIVALGDVSGLNAENSVIFKRNIQGIAAEVIFDDFMVPLQSLQVSHNIFSFEYVINNKKPAPDPDLYLANIAQISDYTDPDTGNRSFITYYPWRIYAPGDINTTILPKLPTAEEVGGPVPQGLINKKAYYWEPQAIALSLQENFDFNHLEFDGWGQYASHAASNSLAFYADF